MIGRDQVERRRAASAPHSASRWSRLADRRRALELGRAVRDLLGRERQVVRTGLGGDRRRRRALARAISSAASADATCTMCTRAPNSRASRTIMRIASTSASGGRVREIRVAYRRISGPRCGSAQRPDRAGDSACTSSGTPRRARIGIAASQIALVDRGELVDAGRHEEALEAAHAGVDEPVELRRVARHDAAPERRRRRDTGPAPPSASPRAPPRVVVAGMLLSGMSTIVVTPPAAAARVAVSKPSHSVRPGSLMWTCVSTMPGETTRSPTSIRRSPRVVVRPLR